MSVLTINKLTASVGAEVTGLDSDVLATDDALGHAVLDALEDNGVLVFPGLGLDPRRRWRSAGGSARSTTRPTATIRSPASTR